jgi:hypothetical protein
MFGCTKMILTLKQLAEENIEYNKNMFMAFIDQDKVFYSLSHNFNQFTLHMDMKVK